MTGSLRLWLFFLLGDFSGFFEIQSREHTQLLHVPYTQVRQGVEVWVDKLAKQALPYPGHLQIFKK
jgi:hypothetical protein